MLIKAYKGVYPLFTAKKAGYKVCLCVIVLSVTVCTVGYVCSFCGAQIFVLVFIHDNLWSFIYMMFKA